MQRLAQHLVGCWQCQKHDARIFMQGFLAWLGYAAIARFAAFQFLGTTTSLTSAALLGFAMDLSGLIFMFAHRMLARSYAAACQSHSQLSHSGEEHQKRPIVVPRTLAAISHIFMSEQPAFPAAQVEKVLM